MSLAKLLEIFSLLLCVTNFVLAQSTAAPPFSKTDVQSAEKIIGLSFTDAERDSMMDGLMNLLNQYRQLRGIDLANSVWPALLFNPIPVGAVFDAEPVPFEVDTPAEVKRPANLEEVAFWSIPQLAELIRTRQVTSVELTEMYLKRLRKYGPILECVVTLTDSLALAQARQADAEIAAGNYRGLLHGLPYGAKDLLAAKGYKTTWGAMPYKEQVIDMDATVITKLREAGAVLVAKLTLGALAWGDVWYGGKTRNPWNIEQGSSGSSAGSAAATSAGLVAFAIGSETWGSIVSPCTRNRVSGLRPTYGRVSRTGAMALSWSMDKLGPICRTAEDCAIVLNAIYGPDNLDQTVIDLPFNYRSDMDVSQLRLGYLKKAFDEADSLSKPHLQKALQVFREMGFELVPIALPELPIWEMSYILSAEAAAAFDELTRSNRDDLLVRQIKNAWPNEFRTSRFIPAVEYINANRLRYLWVQEMAKLFQDVDAYLAPSFGENLLLTNLTGHPCVVVPNGAPEQSLSIIGNLFDEGTIVALAKRFQEKTGYHLQHPDLSKWVKP
jgi:Asp-tRNA(Asn)/Glu-tRNA(Gln) amidotransferase A subunit family amidase